MSLIISLLSIISYFVSIAMNTLRWKNNSSDLFEYGLLWLMASFLLSTIVFTHLFIMSLKNKEFFRKNPITLSLILIFAAIPPITFIFAMKF